jgi:hypothetical protein
VPLAVALLALVLAGCAREKPDVQAVRKASERYLRALGRKELDVLRTTSTCVVSMNTIAGGRVLSIGPAEPGRVSGLDSILVAAESDQRRADSLWYRASPANADSLYRWRRRLGLRYVVCRNAQRAALLSLPDSAITGATPIETRRVLVRVRYAGALIGPRPVDREEVLRLLKAGAGHWIAYSLYLTRDDPMPPSR